MRGLLIILALSLVSFTSPQKRILFVGDSLTSYSNGWQDAVGRAMGVDYDVLARGGKRTSWMLKALEEQLRDDSEYDEVVIYGGINDSFSYVSSSSTIQNLQSMVDLCNRLRIKPIVIVGYNPDRVIHRTMYGGVVTKVCRDRYIVLQNKIRTNLRGCKIIQMEDSINREDSDDGIHLRASGHRKFARWILKNI
jgi:lysophospholipase L1-like esterase